MNYTKKSRIWTQISPASHDALFQAADERHMTSAKLIKQMIYTDMVDKDALLHDYSFVSEGARMVAIIVSDDELETVKEIAVKYKISICMVLRRIIYTYLQQNKLL